MFRPMGLDPFVLAAATAALLRRLALRALPPVLALLVFEMFCHVLQQVREARVYSPKRACSFSLLHPLAPTFGDASLLSLILSLAQLPYRLPFALRALIPCFPPLPPF